MSNYEKAKLLTLIIEIIIKIGMDCYFRKSRDKPTKDKHAENEPTKDA